MVRGIPNELIVSYAEIQNVDLIAMPTHGRRGLHRFFLGSVTERVVVSCDVPVLTIRPDNGERRYSPRDVLCPVDGSDCSKAALDVAVELAKTEGATLHFLHVVETNDRGIDVRSAVEVDRLEQRGKRFVARAVDVAEEASIDSITTTIEYGRVGRTVRSYLDEHDVDLLVAGTHGRRV